MILVIIRKNSYLNNYLEKLFVKHIILICSLIRTTPLSSISNLKNAKNFKKMISEEVMTIAWFSQRWWNSCVLEDEKKEIDPIFIWKL